MSKPILRMTMVLALLSAAGVAGGLSGCAAGKTSIPTADELGGAVDLPRGTDLDALRRGRAVLVTECATCHRLFLPHEYPQEQWRGIVKRMAGRASLGREQAADLELYLAVSSRAGR
ncbi:MAG: diheme cytochrome c [Deltaproteobacteria bacterium]|nr:diheme cytochrome c [Deltaproteobacteria bacterium]